MVMSEQYPNALLRALHAFEEGFLVFLLFSILLLAMLDIVLRNLFGGGLIWVAPLIRILVMWLGLFGALLATRYHRHIAVDIVLRFLSSSVLKRIVLILGALFSATVCGLAAWYSAFFVHGSWLYQDQVFHGLPAWLAQWVIPWTLLIMSLRFLLQAVAYALGDEYISDQTNPISS